jgi:NTP pyrophosphatase (non-canonical NTP hydrolase)
MTVSPNVVVMTAEEYHSACDAAFQRGVDRGKFEARSIAPTQGDLLQWAANTFGPTAHNMNERAARLVEEAIEAAQACGLSLYVVEQIGYRVYSRPAGELRQEIGGCAFTLATLAEVAGFDAQYELRREFDRVTSIDPAFFRAKHAAKVAAGTADLSPPTKGE